MNNGKLEAGGTLEFLIIEFSSSAVSAPRKLLRALVLSPDLIASLPEKTPLQLPSVYQGTYIIQVI